MKKSFVTMLMLMMLISACGTPTNEITEPTEAIQEEPTETLSSESPVETVEEHAETVAPQRKYNEKMSEDEFTRVTNDFIGFSTELSEVFTQMASLTQKHATEIDNSETFDWSKDSEFLEVKAATNDICDKIIEYDDSVCSKEYQLCTDEFKSMAYQLKKYFDTISCEMNPNEINTLTQSLTNDISIGFNNSMIYQMMATATFMESNGADQERIDTVLASIKDTDLYKQAKGIDTTKKSSKPSHYNVVFTNSYGTPDTKCNHTGCNNTIASSGDTNCCVMHSNKCLNCGKYIDEDALFCMDCISGGASDAMNTEKHSKNTVSQEGCKFKYSDGSLCGKETGHYANFCDAHFKQLDDTYNALVGN
jgi:hypothetical protein